MRGFVLVTALMLFGGTGFAQTVRVAAPDDAAAAGMTYAAFLTLAFPGAQLHGAAVTLPGPVTLRTLQGEQTVVDDPAPITVVQGVSVMLGGQAQLAILTTLGPSDGSLGDVAVLAVFGLDPAPALVDLVQVDSDRLTGFGEPATVSTGPGDALIAIDNSHVDAGQGYHQTTLVQLAGQRLQPIDTIAMLDLLVCGWRLEQHLTLTPDTTASPPWPLTARVDETVAADDDCGGDPQPMPAVGSYAVTYAADPAFGIYRRTQGDWSALEAVNADRY